MIIYRILRNISNVLKQAMRRFVKAHIVQDDPCTSELGPDELEVMLQGRHWARIKVPGRSKAIPCDNPCKKI